MPDPKRSVSPHWTVRVARHILTPGLPKPASVLNSVSKFSKARRGSLNLSRKGSPWLLWAWDDMAFSSVTSALRDDAWRVREMALKVVSRHRLEDALAIVADLQEDSAGRVRAAASRALIRLATTQR